MVVPKCVSGCTCVGIVAGHLFPESPNREGKESPYDLHPLNLVKEKREAQAESAHQMCVCSSQCLGSSLQE